jgi:hypothetical protein
MNQEAMLRPALIAGVAVGVLSALPGLGALNCLCCAWVVGGGILAASLCVKASPLTVTLGRGVLLGLLTGVIAAVVDTIFSIPVHFALTGVGMGPAEQLNQLFEEFPNIPSEYREAIRAIFASGDGIGVFVLILVGLLKLVVYGLVCMLGGAVGVAIFEKRPPGTDSRIPPAVYQPPRDFPPPPEIPGT